MIIVKEDVLRMYFKENKRIDEIAKYYGMSSYKFSKYIESQGISLNRSKTCSSCGAGKNNFPPENSGGMTFELTKD